MTRKKKRSIDGVTLSLQQAKILEGVGRGDTYRSIAHKLALSPSTVRYHVGSLQLKLHASSLPNLIVFVMVAGILTTNQLPVEFTGNLFIDGSLIPD